MTDDFIRKPMNETSQRLREKGIYLLPNLFTTASLFLGFYAIIQAMNGQFENATIAIFIAMIADGLDGRIARLTNTQSTFGAEYDSLSDMISFGVAPALIIYIWALKPMGKLGWIAAFVYCACAALRLARFNTQDETDISYKNYFRGLPSPAAASLLAGLVWISREYSLSGDAVFAFWLKMKWIAWVITLITSFSMVSNIPYYNGKEINLKDSVPFVVILLIALSITLIAYSPPEVLFVSSLMYVLSGYVMWILKKHHHD